MENESEFRQWDELIPDALGLIFNGLCLQDKLTVLPCVCKSWREVLNGPYCWQEIDIEDWSNVCPPEQVDRMLHMLMARSCGSVTKLCVSQLRSESITFVLDNAPALKALRLLRSDITDSMIEQVAPRLELITSLDFSYCHELSARAFECVGKHCKSLTRFRRSLHPINMHGSISQEEEAHAVAISMPNLKQLEMAYLLIDTCGVLEILHNCPSLESLDIRGSWNVKLDEKFVKEKYPNLKILGPHVVDDYEKDHSWEVCSDYSDSFYDSDSFDELWDDDDTLEVRFYNEFGEDSDHGWPVSP